MKKTKFLAGLAAAFLLACGLVMFAGCEGPAAGGGNGDGPTPTIEGPWSVLISRNPTAGGSADLTPDQDDYEAGVEITVNAAPNGDYEVQSISVVAGGDVAVDFDNDAKKFTMPKDDVIVTVNFKKVMFNITFNTGNSADTEVEGGLKQKAGSTVTFTATEKVTSIFDSSKVSIAGVADLAYNVATGKFSFTMPEADVVITVAFDAKETGVNGNYVLRIQGGQWSHSKPLVQNGVQLNPGNYRLTIWVRGKGRIEAGVGKVYGTPNWWDGANRIIPYPSGGANDINFDEDDWTEFTYDFTVANTIDGFVINQPLDTKGTPPRYFLYMDNISIYGLNAAGSPEGANRITDGDFENGQAFPTTGENTVGPWFLEGDAGWAFQRVLVEGNDYISSEIIP